MADAVNHIQLPNDGGTNIATESNLETDDFDERDFKESPPSKEEESGEECSVCRNEMIDITTLSDCVHEFCYDCIVGWLTKGSGPFCPMCKTPVKCIMRKGTDEKITLQQIQSLKEPAATASTDLVTEKRIVSRKIRSCRRLMNRIDEIIGATSNRADSNKKQSRVEELNTMKHLCVSQLNSLQMLRDDINHGSAKALIVSKAAFRRLIYERPVVSEELPQDNDSLSKSEFLANIDHYRAVLYSFLNIELKSLPAKTQPRVDHENNWYFYTLHDVADGKEEEIINRMFSIIADRGIQDLTTREVDAALNGLVSCRVLISFIAELRSLLNSRKTFLEWCGTVTYRIRTDLGGERVENEIVTVDDTIEVEPARSRLETLRPRRAPVFNPYDRIFDAPPPTYRGLSDHRRASSSDTDQDEDIYFQAPLRLGPNAINPFRPPPPKIPRFSHAGITWSELTNTSESCPAARTSSPSDSSKNVPVVQLDEEEGVREHEDMGSSSISGDSNEEEIQVVDGDGTIILDDTPECREKVGEIDRSLKKRKEELSLEDYWKISKTDTLPEGLVEDVQALITKYKMPLTQAMNMLVGASQEAIINISSPKPTTSRASTTLANLKPEDFLQIASFMSRNRLNFLLPSTSTQPSTSTAKSTKEH